MICEDCVHHDLCFDNGTLFINFTTTGRKAENVETNCPFKNFKNKSEFAEVVRCKDCKHCTIHNSPTLYAYCEKTHFRFEPFKTDTRTHFCSLGERKDI